MNGLRDTLCYDLKRSRIARAALLNFSLVVLFLAHSASAETTIFFDQSGNSRLASQQEGMQTPIVSLKNGSVQSGVIYRPLPVAFPASFSLDFAGVTTAKEVMESDQS